MNRALRRRHLLLWLILGPAALVLLIAGVAAKARLASESHEPAASGARP